MLAPLAMTYLPQHFRVSEEAALHEFMRAHDFATVVSSAPDGPVISHIPVLVRSTGTGAVVAGHLARANQHWRAMDGATPAIAIFHGPHGYVSPTWYEAAPAVPTWNYGVVHAHGLPAVKEDEAYLRGVLEELSRRYEGDGPGAWSPGGLPADFYGRLLRGIVAFEMPIARLDGKFKLGQNRSSEDRRRTVAALEQQGSREAAALADFMRQHSGA